MREFLTERVWSRHVAGDDPDDRRRPARALVASQLLGVAFQRYALRVEPYASATIEEIAGWVGPVIDRFHRDDSE